MFHYYNDSVIRHCIPEEEVPKFLACCHSYACGGHHGVANTTAKVHTLGLYWPTLHKDVDEFVKSCARCQKVGNFGRRQEMP